MQVRSHAAGALEADKFVETAMLAARQRLQASDDFGWPLMASDGF